MRESTIFYRSFYEAIKELSKEHQAEVYTAIFEYSLNFNEIELTGISKTIFTLIKPQLQANMKRFEAGLEHGHKGGKYGHLGGRPPSKNPQKSLTKPSNNNVNDNNNVNVNDKDNVKENLFERFWNLYDKKEGRKDCERKFNKLKPSDIEKIFQTLPDYIASTPDKKFRKLPETYLNGEHWNDEVARTPKMILPVQNIEFIPKGEDDNW